MGNVAKRAERARVNLGAQNGSLPWPQCGLTLAGFLPSFISTGSARPWPSCSEARYRRRPSCCPRSDFLPGSSPRRVVWISALCVLLGWIWVQQSHRAQQDTPSLPPEPSPHPLWVLVKPRTEPHPQSHIPAWRHQPKTLPQEGRLTL